MTATLKQLAAENEELRSRLEEAEDTLRAIRSGEVDALIVSSAGGARVFTLTGADRSFRSVVEDMNEGALTVSQDGRILFANRRFADMLQTPLDQVIGSTFRSWMLPSDQAQFLAFQRHAEIPSRVRGEVTLLASEGTTVPVHLSSSELQVDDVASVFCLVVTDLTEQKRSEALAGSERSARESLAVARESRLALLSVIEDHRQAELRLRAYAERLKHLHQLDQAVLRAVESPEHITQEAILRCRDLLQCKRVGIGLFDPVRQEVRVFAATPDAESMMQIGRVLPAEIFGAFEALREKKLEIIEDSSRMDTVPVLRELLQTEGIRSAMNAPLVSPSGVIGVMSVCWDIPRTMAQDEQEIVSEAASQIAVAIEHARLLEENRWHAAELEERVRRRTAQLESANQELEAFSHSVSHDLRAPLRHITGYVDLLTTRHREHLPEAARHYLDQVGDSAIQMGALIDELLAFARTGRQELSPTEADMNAAVEDARGRLGAEVKDRTIVWTVADLPRVRADYKLLRQVWVNLLANAIKYTRRTAGAEIEVGATRGPGHWEFFVRDNGVGFDMQYASKLFGVFQRLHAQEDFEGIGIGLANVRRIIHKHGGEVQAEGRLNEGATFRFTIPDDPRGEGGMS